MVSRRPPVFQRDGVFLSKVRDLGSKKTFPSEKNTFPPAVRMFPDTIRTFRPRRQVFRPRAGTFRRPRKAFPPPAQAFPSPAGTLPTYEKTFPSGKKTFRVRNISCATKPPNSRGTRKRSRFSLGITGRCDDRNPGPPIGNFPRSIAFPSLPTRQTTESHIIL